MLSSIREFTKLQQFAFIFITLFGILQVFFVGLTNDTLTMLFYTKHFVEDGGLYQDWIELNSPVTFTIFSIPFLLIKNFDLAYAIAINIWTAGLCLVSLHASSKVLDQSTFSLQQRRSVQLLVACVFFVLPVTVAAFGDREHLLFVFTLPWVLAIILRVSPSVWIGLLAAIGFCIKPYNAVIFIGLILFAQHAVPLASIIFSRATLMIVTLSLIICIAILIAFPHYPQILLQGKYAYDVISRSVLFKAETVFFALIFALPPLFYFKDKGIIRNWWVWFLGCIAIFISNGGWDYTIYLLIAPLAILCGLWYISEGKAWTRQRIIAGLMICTLIAAACSDLKRNIEYTNNTGFSVHYTKLDPQFLMDVHQVIGKHFILLAIYPWGINFAKMTEPPMHVFPYDHLWLLPAAVRHPNEEISSDLRAVLIQAFINTLERYPDASIIVDKSPYIRALPPHYDILGFFMQDVTIRTMMQHYKRVKDLDICQPPGNIGGCAFEIWVPDNKH